MALVYVVTRPEHGKQFCVYSDWLEVRAEFDGAEPGDEIHVVLKDMTPEELEKLPDFEGW